MIKIYYFSGTGNTLWSAKKIAEQCGENELLIEFDSPQRAITPGQAAVLYDGDIVIGGGTISP